MTSPFRASLSFCAGLLLLLGLSACDSTSVEDEAAPVTIEHDFDDGQNGWDGFFTDYSPTNADGFNFVADYRPTPEPEGVGQGAFRLAASNISDDVQMMLKRPVDGLEPGQTYTVEYVITFASNASAGCVGIGGPPGEAVEVLAMASDEEPTPVLTQEGGRDYYRLNAELESIDNDFGGDGAAWMEAATLGTIAVETGECTGEGPYELKTLESASDHWTVTATADGQAWLLVGTRSGFEGRTDLYYTQINATLRPTS